MQLQSLSANTDGDQCWGERCWGERYWFLYWYWDERIFKEISWGEFSKVRGAGVNYVQDVPKL